MGLAVIIAVMLVLAMGYAWLAHAPTGYAGFEKGAAEAQKRVSEKVKPAPRPADVRARVSEAPMRYAILPNGRPGPAHRANFFEEIESYNSYEEQANITYMLTADNKPISQAMKLGWSGIVYCPFFLPEKMRPADGKQFWDGLDAASQVKGEMLRYFQSSFRERNEPTAATDAQKMMFYVYLDNLEGFLLRPRWDIPETSSTLHTGGRSFHRLAMLAIARASLKGDQKLATDLLGRYLDAVRVLHVHDEQGAFTMDNVRQVFFGMAELPDLPDEAWEQARRALESMRLSDAEKMDLLRVRAARFHKMIEQQLEHIDGVPNTWHYVFGGTVESGANRLLKPIVLREAEKMALDISRGDVAEAARHQLKWAGMTMWLNSTEGRDVGKYGIMQISLIENLNAEVDRALLYLQIARARRAKKEMPAVTTQGAEHLEMFKMDRFGVFTISSYGGPGNPGYDQKKPLMDAIRKFQATGKVATRPEDIEAVIKAAGPGDWAKYVVWVEPKTVYLIWGMRRMQSSDIWYFASLRDWKASVEWVNAVEVYAVVIDGPILSEWMKGVLKETRASNPTETIPRWVERGERLAL
ncbi:hypothetical protein LLG95_04355 [bacterium]|nr:hypothetical protein [bacterium]